MEIFFDLLPKDLVYIIQDYSKDKEQYDKVLNELKNIINFKFLNGLWKIELEPELGVLTGDSIYTINQLNQYYRSQKLYHRIGGESEAQSMFIVDVWKAIFKKILEITFSQCSSLSRNNSHFHYYYKNGNLQNCSRFTNCCLWC